MQNLDTAMLARDIRFFYPFEIQIVDRESNDANSLGEASHQEYKKSQLRSAFKRIFGKILKEKNINWDS